MKNLWLGYDISTEAKPVLSPTRIDLWQDKQFKNIKPESPLFYKSDALVGLSLTNLKSPAAFSQQAWRALEPHYELYLRSQSRLNEIKSFAQPAAQSIVTAFERAFTEILDSSLHPWGIDLKNITYIVEAIDHLETRLGYPILYNMTISFSKEVANKMHYLHSLLFHLRALVATEYNSHVTDPTFDALKMDSITDYLPKAEYVANDSLLYWNLVNMQKVIPDEVYKKLDRSFRDFSHHAYCLIDSMPKKFLSALTPSQIEDALYLSQMDWLLGAESGLLFKIREELYGLKQGYHEIFWPETEGKPHQKSFRLSINCQVSEKDIYPHQKAA